MSGAKSRALRQLEDFTTPGAKDRAPNDRVAADTGRGKRRCRKRRYTETGNRINTACMPVLLSAVEGAPAYATDEELGRDLQARGYALFQRAKQRLWHPAVEGARKIFLADKGPRRCHC